MSDPAPARRRTWIRIAGAAGMAWLVFNEVRGIIFAYTFLWPILRRMWGWP